MSFAILLFCAAILPSAPHVLEVEGLLPAAEEGLLLGNGDLSVSVWPQGDTVSFALGKGDVWDRRLAYNDGVRPVTLKEYRRGLLEEGWKTDWGQEPVATKGSKNPKRMREVVTGVSPNLGWHPYPCPKPVGTFRIHVPRDLPGPAKWNTRLYIEEGRVTVDVIWKNGVKLAVEAVIPPEKNILSVAWRVAGWTDETRMGRPKTPPVAFDLFRLKDPDYESERRRLAEDDPSMRVLHPYPRGAEPLPAPTVSVNMIEQRFPPENTYTNGFFCRSWLHFRDKSAGHLEHPKPSGRGAFLRYRPNPGVLSGEIGVIVQTTADRGCNTFPDTTKGHADWRAAARAAARAAWSRSALSIPGDPFLERLWYATYHARRCVLKPDKTPPGLFFPSTVGNFSLWHGDWHANYNLQGIYWGAFTANRLDEARTYFQFVRRWLVPIGRKIARDYYGCRGVFFQLEGFPVDAVEDFNGSVPLGRMAYMTGWMMTAYWHYWQYVRDRAWLAAEGYPMMRDVALFYLDFLLKAPHPDLPPQLNDGLYHAFPSNSGENMPNGDPMAFCDAIQVSTHIRFALWAAIGAARELNADAELVAQWQDRLDHLAKVRRDLKGYAKHCYDCCSPEFERTARPYVAPKPWTGEPARRTGNDFFYYGLGIAGRIGRLRNNAFVPERDFPLARKLIESWTHPNGLVWGMAMADYARAGAWTETLSCMAPFQEMMLQSWDGAIRLFPWWPKDRDAAFRDWRAQGAFLVTAAQKGGKVSDVSVVSEKGEPCLVHGNWRVTDGTGRSVSTDRDAFGRLRFKTVPGGRYRLQQGE